MLVKDKYKSLPDDDIDSIMESIMAGNNSKIELGSSIKSTDNKSRNTRVLNRDRNLAHHKSTRTTKASDLGIRSRRAPSDIEDFKTTRGNIRHSHGDGQYSINPPARVRQSRNMISRRVSAQTVSAEDISHEIYSENARDNNDIKSNKRKVLSITAIFISLILIPVISFTFLKEPIMALLKPKSPFAAELMTEMKIPLYYPTKLPGTYKMEINSITQPEGGVLLYAITDDKDNKINISIQRQAENIDTESIYTDSNNIKNIETKFGKVKFGKTDADLDIANVMTGQSWIIITTPTGTIDEKELQLIIDSLEY